MSNLSIQNRVALSEPMTKANPTPVQPDPSPSLAKNTSVSSLAKDTVSTSTVLKGALKGGLVAGGAVAVPGLLYTASQKGMSKAFSIHMTGYGAVGAAAAGVLAGAVVAGSGTESKAKGAFIGAVVGAAAGATAMGIMSKNVNAAAAGALFGMATGAVGGVVGTLGTPSK